MQEWKCNNFVSLILPVYSSFPSLYLQPNSNKRASNEIKCAMFFTEEI